MIQRLVCAVALALAAAVPLPARADIESFAFVQDDGSLEVRGRISRLLFPLDAPQHR